MQDATTQSELHPLRIWLTSSRSVSGVMQMTPRGIIAPTVYPSLLMTS
jgi:hypothetical protein